MRHFAVILLLTQGFVGVLAKAETVMPGASRRPVTPSLLLPSATRPEPSPSADATTERNAPSARATATGQLPPEILVDQQLVRAERLLAANAPGAALEVMNEILALQDRHDLVLDDDFRFRYAQVALAAGQTRTATMWLSEYLLTPGSEGQFYREALELLNAAELRRSPPIFDTTPFRDKNQVFYNVGNDIFATKELPRHHPFSQCLYQELFPEVPVDGECYAADILAEGTDAVVLEAQVVGDVPFGGQDRVRTLASAIEQGGRDGRIHWTWQSYGSIALKLRMMDSGSRPILPPSFMPKGTIQAIGFERDARQQRARMHVFNLVVGHHSNGQSGCSFLDQNRDAEDRCVSVRDSPRTSGQYVNYTTGNFSTHYFQGSYYYRRVALSSRLAVRSEASFGLGLELHFPCMAGALCELEELYGRNRLWASLARETKGYEYSFRSMRAFGNKALTPWWAEAEFVKFLAGRHGVYIRAYAGQDPYNIRFVDPTSRLEVGMRFRWEGDGSSRRW